MSEIVANFLGLNAAMVFTSIVFTSIVFTVEAWPDYYSTWFFAFAFAFLKSVNISDRFSYHSSILLSCIAVKVGGNCKDSVD